MNSKNLYFTIFSLILLGFISSCAENSNKCRPSYASNIEQLNEKLYDSYANVAVRENNTTSDDIITPEYFEAHMSRQINLLSWSKMEVQKE